MYIHDLRPYVPILGCIILGTGCSSPDPESSIDRETIEARVDLTIGAHEGEDAYVFGRISGLALDADGQIFVADAQADEVRQFDDDGVFVRVVARPGSGPGEVRAPCCLAFDGTGALWLRDTGNARYNGYDLQGDDPVYLALRRMAHGSAGFWVETTFGGNGGLIDVGHVDGELARFHLDSASAVQRTERITAPPPDSVGMYTVERTNSAGARVVAYLYQPFGPRHLVAHSPAGGFATAVSSQYAVTWIGPDSSFTRQLTADVAGPALSADERSLADERIEDDRMRWEVPRSQVPFDIPGTKPPLRALRFAATGELWVFLNVPDGADHIADVYGRDGQLIHRVRWPADVDLRSGYLLDDVALGIRRDELDIPYVVRLEFAKQSTS